jgi:hypothetical protein
MSTDHQIVVMHCLVHHSGAFAGTLPFVRWARNNAKRLVDVDLYGGIEEFIAQVAAA